MSVNIRDYVSNDHIESIGEIARGQANIIQALSLDNSQKDKEIERLTAESTKWESKFYDEAKKVDRAIEYIEKNSYTTIETIDDINYFIVRLDKCADLLDILKGVDEE